MQWAVELGQIDLTQAVSLMARFRNAPQEQHMEAVLHIFGYIKGHLNSKVVFDPAYRNWIHINWHDDAEWKEFYPGAAKPMLPLVPEPRGREVLINIYCDTSHATCLATQRSTTSILMFLNGAAVRWYSKCQNTVESSTFGSEFIAMKIAMEMNSVMHYKLRMMGVPITGPSYILSDNQGVVRNVTNPVLQLTKHHNAIAYHKCHEEVAAGAAFLAFDPGKENCSNGLTKIWQSCIRWIIACGSDPGDARMGDYKCPYVQGL